MSDRHEVIIERTNPAVNEGGVIMLWPEVIYPPSYDDIREANEHAAKIIFTSDEPLVVTVRDVKGRRVKTRWTLSESGAVIYEVLVLTRPAIQHKRPGTFEEFSRLFSIA